MPFSVTFCRRPQHYSSPHRLHVLGHDESLPSAHGPVHNPHILYSLFSGAGCYHYICVHVSINAIDWAHHGRLAALSGLHDGLHEVTDQPGKISPNEHVAYLSPVASGLQMGSKMLRRAITMTCNVG